MAYYFRAQKMANRRGADQRLSWLRQIDQDERGAWVWRFRQILHTLGQVIQFVFTQRDAHWTPVIVYQPRVTREVAKGVGKGGGG